MKQPSDKCKAEYLKLKVTTTELAELLRTTLATLMSYDSNQMCLQFRISQCPFFSLAASPLHARADSLFKLSETLCGFPSKLPSCDIAFLLSRSLNEVDTKFTVTAIDDQNVLDIFRNKSKKYSWFGVYAVYLYFFN